ncbi:hypothetical protein [Streptomyces sp. NBC_01465]|nr:hypothetical protein [Streptomyces sp. NBC_01465]
MSEYSVPDDGAMVAARARSAWAATCEALPPGVEHNHQVKITLT